MHDFSEFRRHWRPLLAAFLGLASALSLNSYILSTFAPYMIAEFHWTRSEWALLGIVQILTLITLPVAGRLTDLFGVRRVAAVGALSFPVFLVAIATMSGSIHVYLAIYIAQTVLGSASTATVYSRVVAQSFHVRRGLALGIFGCSTPLVAALGAPLVTTFVAAHGWRAGYLAIAAFSAVCAVATLALLPSASAKPAGGVTARPLGAYRAIAAMPAFWLMLLATFLVNFPFSVAMSQLKLVALAQGLTDSSAALAISAFAIGSIAGRILSGLALDALPAQIVAAVGFGLPFVGLLILASGLDTTGAVIFAILLLGLSFGGEGDVIPVLVTRYFGIGVFSTVMGLLSAAIGTALALGNVLIGVTLAATNSFTTYLLFAAAAAFLGSATFLLLGLPRFRAAPQWG
ncbi:MAG: MFS transporter [Sphingomonadales bacterium]|nr:MFS transporter [Sphingomonadales bacterium]